ncbi:zinc-ribbon domain-containing protein [Rossellomorea marisflavi]|uniref:zinc-ribbon domain-containing protein n=1 Tax=Rossellomorea marisflavi TaxID=189381 RepID=UPI00345CB6ED
MAILEKEVLVRVNPSNVNHYLKLGYEVEKSINTKGQLRIDPGATLMVKVQHLTKGSHTRLTSICDICGKCVNKMYPDILKSRKRGDGLDRCRSCTSKRTQKIRNKSIPYERSLEYFAIKNNKEYLLEEFHESNKIHPSQIGFSSNVCYLWKCIKCGSEFEGKAGNRTISNCDCPYCSNTKVNETNSLWKTDPGVAKMLVDELVGHKVTRGSGKKFEFKCPTCNSIYKKFIKNVVNLGIGCMKCSDGFSYPEKIMINILDQLHVDFETQKSFEWSENKRYDFFLPELNCIIETHGSQHYKGSYYKFNRYLEDEIINDRLKEDNALANDIEHYIIINCSKSNLEFIKSSCLKSKLTDLLNLKLINWIKCEEFASETLVRETCEMWNSTNYSTTKIAEELSISSTTVLRYLKKGVEIGICNYSKNSSINRSRSNYGKTFKVSVIQFSLQGEFIKKWDAIVDAAKEIGIHSTGIGMACKGKLRQSGGFKWMYEKDYQELLKKEDSHAR